MIPRSWLFVPGDSPRKLEKGWSSGADALILDLEDSVAPSAKADARARVTDFLEARRRAPGPQLWVRINPLASGLAEAELEAVMPAGPAGIVLPKSDSSEDLKRLDTMLGASPARVLVLATETPISLFTLNSYAGASERLLALTWGAEDLSSAVGAVTARDPDGALTPLYQLARSLCLAGAVAAGAAPIEAVYPDYSDLDGLAAYAARGRRDGFVGQMAIHPAQVAVINTAFTPADAEIEEAQRIVALFDANPGVAAFSFEGRMVDIPHLAQARRTLARSIS